MPPLNNFRHNSSLLYFTGIISALVMSFSLNATEYEITPIVGYNFSADLNSSDNLSNVSVTDDANIGLAFSWKESANGKGQILVNYIKRDFTDDTTQSTHSFDTLYTHFSGVAIFKQRNYTTTVGLGLGATYISNDWKSSTYPSVTASIGTQYNISENMAFVTELRTYATLTKNDDSLFCDNGTCMAKFDGAIWVDNQISIGLSYRF